MKYFVVLFVIVIGIWLLLRGRKHKLPAARRPSDDPLPQAMVQCAHCGVHLPRAEALVGERGLYCSDEHRLARPRAN